MDYHITAKGEERRQELSTFFIIETVMLYKRSKELFSTQIGELRLLGIEEIMLFGASDTCEMVSAVAERYGLKVLGIVDSDPNKHGSTFCGRQVQDPSLILKLKPQAVIITSSGNIDEIAASLTEAQAHGIKIVKLQV